MQQESEYCVNTATAQLEGDCIVNTVFVSFLHVGDGDDAPAGGAGAGAGGGGGATGRIGIVATSVRGGLYGVNSPHCYHPHSILFSCLRTGRSTF